MKKCRICECTDADGCAMPCRWVTDDLCSTCADFLEMMAAYMIVVGPHDRHTINHATLAVRRCLAEVDDGKMLPEIEPPPEPLIVLAKP